MVAYGNLDNLNQDPAKYNAFISTKTKDGFVPDVEQDRYFVRSKQSPPARSYGPTVNWNIAASGVQQLIMEEVLLLRTTQFQSSTFFFVDVCEEEIHFVKPIRNTD